MIVICFFTQQEVCETGDYSLVFNYYENDTYTPPPIVPPVIYPTGALAYAEVAMDSTTIDPLDHVITLEKCWGSNSADPLCTTPECSIISLIDDWCADPVTNLANFQPSTNGHARFDFVPFGYPNGQFVHCTTHICDINLATCDSQEDKCNARRRRLTEDDDDTLLGQSVTGHAVFVVSNKEKTFANSNLILINKISEGVVFDDDATFTQLNNNQNDDPLAQNSTVFAVGIGCVAIVAVIAFIVLRKGRYEENDSSDGNSTGHIIDPTMQNQGNIGKKARSP
eukprot:TRINITY_DN434266_c0_g1_i2.p1 TRINITY_DN434266_c0_g1~~TRINITY_DN434266_c0_g1_i2.p1  ORF type:complete len:282 (-),score=74.99 TRINITY_DN434266_c0_g1_i2:153-998(-)